MDLIPGFSGLLPPPMPRGVCEKCSGLIMVYDYAKNVFDFRFQAVLLSLKLTIVDCSVAIKTDRIGSEADTNTAKVCP